MNGKTNGYHYKMCSHQPSCPVFPVPSLNGYTNVSGVRGEERRGWDETLWKSTMPTSKNSTHTVLKGEGQFFYYYTPWSPDGQEGMYEISSIMFQLQKILYIVMTSVLWARDDMWSQVSGLFIVLCLSLKSSMFDL